MRSVFEGWEGAWRRRELLLSQLSRISSRSESFLLSSSLHGKLQVASLSPNPHPLLPSSPHLQFRISMAILQGVRRQVSFCLHALRHPSLRLQGFSILPPIPRLLPPSPVPLLCFVSSSIRRESLLSCARLLSQNGHPSPLLRSPLLLSFPPLLLFSPFIHLTPLLSPSPHLLTGSQACPRPSLQPRASSVYRQLNLNLEKVSCLLLPRPLLCSLPVFPPLPPPPLARLVLLSV
eukprot:514410-Hanusia_phi.AAC.2